MESDRQTKQNSVGQKVRIFFNSFKYEGILVYEDDVIYRLDDSREGLMNIPRNNSVLKEIE